jgi:hypothetical protein
MSCSPFSKAPGSLQLNIAVSQKDPTVSHRFTRSDSSNEIPLRMTSSYLEYQSTAVLRLHAEMLCVQACRRLGIARPRENSADATTFAIVTPPFE